MAPPTDLAPIRRSARLTTAHNGVATIHLSYDGTLPPTEVLEELRRCGWRDALPGSPPSTAIDWSRPDEHRGLRYSLRPFQAVTTAFFDGTVEERSAAVEWAQSVLDRCGFVSEESAPASSAPSPAPSAAPVLGAATFEVVVAEATAPGVRAHLDRAGTVVDERADILVTEVTFRGNRSEMVDPVTRFVVEVPAGSEEDFVAALALLRVLEVHRP
ncbi:hypothetical protein [Actinospongicola halichondriae]|uniref:hypothetical protein n=1 Tax=Actinospongicola halichondriae TaxID=3236844 RepID=UPI003D5B8E67